MGNLPSDYLAGKLTIFCDSRSVLDALSSSSKNSNTNYLIPLCRSKFHSLSRLGYSIKLAWIPLHVGIPGNEGVDALKQAAINDKKPKFKIPFTDYYAFSSRDL